MFESELFPKIISECSNSPWEALGVIATLAAVVMAFWLQRKQRLDDKKDKRLSILSALSIELISNLEALAEAHITEVYLDTSAYNAFMKDPTLFNIEDNKTLLSKLNILYKNFKFYNYLWQDGKKGSQLKERMFHIYLYYSHILNNSLKVKEEIKRVSVLLNKKKTERLKVRLLDSEIKSLKDKYNLVERMQDEIDYRVTMLKG